MREVWYRTDVSIFRSAGLSTSSPPPPVDDSGSSKSYGWCEVRGRGIVRGPVAPGVALGWHRGSLGKHGQQGQSCREDEFGRHGPGGGEVLQHVAAPGGDARHHLGVTGLIAVVMDAVGADERVGYHLAVQAFARPCGNRGRRCRCRTCAPAPAPGSGRPGPAGPGCHRPRRPGR
jgi:hypothetical protein